MNATRTVERLRVTGGDRQTVSHAGTHLLGELADRVGLTSAYSAAVPWTGERAFGHDRGRLLGQVAVMLAAGGRCVADMAALRDQPDVFGEVASAPTIWRAFDQVDAGVLDSLRAARARARATAWAAGATPAQVVLDVDASLVEIHSERKQGATPHFKRGFGFHPMFCFLDASGEALAGVFRAGERGGELRRRPVGRRRPWPSPSCPPNTSAGTSLATTPTAWCIRSWCVPTPLGRSARSSTGSSPGTASSRSPPVFPTLWTLPSPPSPTTPGGRRSTPTANHAAARRSPSWC